MLDSQNDLEDLLQSIDRNDEGVLRCLQMFVGLFGNLSDLSSLLYDSG
jgi:hypothetical protein